MFKWREEQERETLDKVKIIWCVMGTFIVQLMGRPGHFPVNICVVDADNEEDVLPDTMLMSVLGKSSSWSSLECMM